MQAFRVARGLQPAASPPSADVVAVRYIEPIADNAGALGVNSMSVAAARDAIEIAARQSTPVASAGFRLSPEMASVIAMVMNLGAYATEIIRAFEQEQQLAAIHIVALTAHAMREQQMRCLKSGMDDFLTKPLAFERLKQLLMQMFWQADN